jgi:DNA polymerase elongation subunit (family B)
MISKDKIEFYGNYLKTHSVEELAEEFGLKYTTAAAYSRRIRQWNAAKKEPYKEKKPKILIFDIETTPNIGAFWSPWKTNIAHGQTLRGWNLLTWAAKWYGGADIMSDRLTPEEAAYGNDKRIAISLRNVIDEADVVVAHNGKRFDVKKMNARFLFNNIPQPSPYKVIDTLVEIKKKFAFTYNNLDYLTNTLTERDGKTDTDMSLWLDCMDGNKEALKKMDDYCQNDVYILEELYTAIRGWISPSVNMAVYYDDNEMRCSHCGSDDIINTGKYKVTQVGKYEIYKCNVCGNFSSGRKNTLSRDKREVLLTNYR